MLLCGWSLEQPVFVCRPLSRGGALAKVCILNRTSVRRTWSLMISLHKEQSCFTPVRGDYGHAQAASHASSVQPCRALRVAMIHHIYIRSRLHRRLFHALSFFSAPSTHFTPSASICSSDARGAVSQLRKLAPKMPARHSFACALTLRRAPNAQLCIQAVTRHSVVPAL